ncbi:MAG: hypothetical protein AAF486_02175 [Pseudomonadota bacterium]
MQSSAAVFLAMLAPSLHAEAQRVSPNLEYHILANAGYAWTPVTYRNTYTAPVIVCSYVLATNANPPATIRVDPVSASQFRIRVQQFEDDPNVAPSTVYCLVSETGVFTLPGGMTYEALTVLSDETSGSAVGWQQSRLEPLSLSASFSDPVLIGQVMSYNDPRASVFHATDCERRQNPPFETGFADGACVGKHVGMINTTRASETLGVIVIETGTVTANNFTIQAGRTGNNVAGVGNAPPYSNTVSSDYDVGMASMAGENGGNGGWWVFYGADPLPPGQIRGAIEEEVTAGDTSRGHINEQVDYWLFDDNNTPDLSLDKTAPTSTFAAAGEDVVFSFDIENTGNTAVTALALSDDQIGPVTCPETALAAGETMTCSASYTTTLGDVADGSVTNIATLTGDSFYGAGAPSASDTWTLTLGAGPSDLVVEKTVRPHMPGGYALPGEDVIYTLTVTNRGSASPDDGTLFLVDAVPDEVSVFTGDMDDGGPATGPLYFEESGTALIASEPAELAMSNSPIRPSTIAECTYTPIPGVYDPSVTFICAAPQGTMPGNTPDPSFSVSFRAQLK